MKDTIKPAANLTEHINLLEKHLREATTEEDAALLRLKINNAKEVLSRTKI